jgi:hypothetical protein
MAPLWARPKSVLLGSRGDAMPSLLKYTPCPQCGHRHHFSLALGEVEPDREYDYVCPEKGTRGRLRAASVGEGARWAPQGAVALTPDAAAE